MGENEDELEVHPRPLPHLLPPLTLPVLVLRRVLRRVPVMDRAPRGPLVQRYRVAAVPLLSGGHRPSLRPLEPRQPVEQELLHLVPALLPLPVRLLLVVLGLERPRRRPALGVADVGVPHRAVRVVHVLRVAGVVRVVVGVEQVHRQRARPERCRTPPRQVVVALHHPVLPVVQLVAVARGVLPLERPADLLGVLLEVPLGRVRVAEVLLLQHRVDPCHRDPLSPSLRPPQSPGRSFPPVFETGHGTTRRVRLPLERSNSPGPRRGINTGEAPDPVIRGRDVTGEE